MNESTPQGQAIDRGRQRVNLSLYEIAKELKKELSERPSIVHIIGCVSVSSNGRLQHASGETAIWFEDPDGLLTNEPTTMAALSVALQRLPEGWRRFLVEQMMTAEGTRDLKKHLEEE